MDDQTLGHEEGIDQGRSPGKPSPPATSPESSDSWSNASTTEDKDGQISLTFRPSGIQTLTQETAI